MKLIRDEKGRLIGQIIENGNVTYIRDGHGDHVGNGDQLLRMLDR